MKYAIIDTDAAPELTEDEIIGFLNKTYLKMRESAEEKFDIESQEPLKNGDTVALEAATDKLARRYGVAEYWLNNGKKAWNV